ncbi:hypothetical protein FACS1894142_7600 [Spirochaetia bacterium]|nr:hypothetical protein FACS1894142_7600 [Spirochaetia bacterium]
MKALTSRERLTRIFRGEEIDRPALKLWGFYHGQGMLHPDYEPVYRRAAELSDWFAWAESPFDMAAGQNTEKLITREYKPHSDLWKELVITYHTPKGNLTEREMVSTINAPGYTMEHAIKEPEDLTALLSMPYEPFPFQAEHYFNTEAQIGDKGVTMFGLNHAAYFLHRLMGSETLAFFSMDCRDLLHRAAAVFADRLRQHVQSAIDAGVRGIFSWVGPEVFLPPLMAPKDFEDFVFNYDKPLCDLIHNAGGHTWVHVHGKVNNFIEGFIEMGIDVLNPLEPPKNGDINMSNLVKKYGSRMGWEGNIEIQEIIQAEPDRLISLIHECVEAGAPSGRFILGPSAGYMEYPFPEPGYIRNLLIYLEEGYKEVEKYR